MRTIFLILTASLLLLTACSDTGEVPELNTAEMPVSSDSAEDLTEPQPEEFEIDPDSLPEEEPETAPPETIPPSIIERIASVQHTENTHIFDDEGLFSQEVTEKYNDYLEWLSVSRQISTAVVITTHLDGVTPEEFAKGYYQTLHGKESSGFYFTVMEVMWGWGPSYQYRKPVMSTVSPTFRALTAS